MKVSIQAWVIGAVTPVVWNANCTAVENIPDSSSQSSSPLSNGGSEASSGSSGVRIDGDVDTCDLRWLMGVGGVAVVLGSIKTHIAINTTITAIINRPLLEFALICPGSSFCLFLAISLSATSFPRVLVKMASRFLFVMRLHYHVFIACALIVVTFAFPHEFDAATEARTAITDLLQQGQDNSACADLAAALTKEIIDSVAVQQKAQNPPLLS